jgi:hypothetical protein
LKRRPIIEAFFNHPSAVFWTAIALMAIVPSIAHYWWRIRQSEIDASLKQEMLQRGMSAEEIQMVLAASTRDAARQSCRSKQPG